MKDYYCKFSRNTYPSFCFEKQNAQMQLPTRLKADKIYKKN